MHKVEQLLHGYQRGHEQLAGSVRLPVKDAELVTRLSDLSGTLSGAPKFNSYLTVYPLPSGKYFAVGRTWPDPSAPRAGCVLTHTLLVPIQVWTTLLEPRTLEGLFTVSSSRSTADYDSAIPIPNKISSEGSMPLNSAHLLTFVHRYFGEGKRPVVLLGQNDPEEVLWRLLRGLWPKLRATFSACTFCLQPRTLVDRGFEVMFAPAAVYPRFTKISAEQIIGAAVDRQKVPDGETIESWCKEWSNELFAPKVLWAPPGEPDLWAELDEDPAAVRRLYLLEKLMEDTGAAPQVFVGAMDLVESVAKDRDSAIQSKRRVAERALSAAREVKDRASGLECLGLIEDRLRRSSFSGLSDTIGPALLDAVAAHTRNSPESAIQSSVLLPAGASLNDSWFGRGLLLGFRSLAHDEPGKLLLLRNAAGIAGRILMDPEVGSAFISMAVARKPDTELRADILGWLSGIQDAESRGKLRSTLLPILGSDDVDILAELLTDLRADEVSQTLSVIWHRTGQFESSSVRALVIEQIARDHPIQTRAWSQRLKEWLPVVAHIFAATYPPTRDGLTELLEAVHQFDADYRAEAVAAFLAGLGPSRYPYWILDVIREQISILSCLLGAVPSDSDVVNDQMRKLLNEASDLPIPQLSSLLPAVLESSQCTFFPALVNLTIRNLMLGYASGIIRDEVARPFQEDKAVAPWFATVDPWELRSLVSGAARLSRLHWSNLWRWTAIAPQALYAREPMFLRAVIDELWNNRHSEWPQQVSDSWAEILRRSRSESIGTRSRIVLCVQALKLSFANTRLPLSPVVVEAFSDVYVAVSGSNAPPEVSPLFSILDWDKAKELRRDLVNCFVRSQWPPGDLAFAVGEVALLRKIFKRLLRTYGGWNYAQAAIADLDIRTDNKATEYARALRNMQEAPDFYEEWD